MRCGAVWCGAVRCGGCGIVWCGAVRCSVVGVVLCGVVWCGVVRCGAVRVVPRRSRAGLLCLLAAAGCVPACLCADGLPSGLSACSEDVPVIVIVGAPRTSCWGRWGACLLHAA